jgi:cobalt-zinc-cadmium efflux system membrane fusion protein
MQFLGGIHMKHTLTSLVLILAAGCADGAQTPDTDATALAAPAEAHDVVTLDSLGVSIANITVVPVEMAQTSGLRVTGTITFDANQVSHVGPRTSGRIVELPADIGAEVRGGEALAALESTEVASVRAEETEAEALTAIAQEHHERARRLQEQGISSQREVLEAEAELRRAEAALGSARQRLDALGAAAGEGGEHTLTAPFAGVVVARDASLGEMVSPEDQLFTVANLDRLWIELDVYERDLSEIAMGQAVQVTTTAYSGRTFPGEIVYVGDLLDPATRTVRARVEVTNPERALKPGMFATALIEVGEAGEAVPAVPEEAVQEMEGRSVVFVPGDLPGEFRVRTVETGELIEGGRVLVLSGLGPEDSVVTTGAFTLRSELAEAEIGEAGHVD